MALCRHVRPLALTRLDGTLLEPLPSVQPHNFPTLSLLLASLLLFLSLLFSFLAYPRRFTFLLILPTLAFKQSL